MIKSFVSEKYGNIVYEESFWTGKKSVKIDGVLLKSVNKNLFQLIQSEEKIVVTLTGNFAKGATLNIGDEKYEISPKTLWYEYILFVLPFILIMVWGNSVVLCSIIPVVGGAIGGAISGGMGVVSLSLMKRQSNPLVKVLVGIGMLVAIFVICAVLGFAIMASLV